MFRNLVLLRTYLSRKQIAIVLLTNFSVLAQRLTSDKHFPVKRLESATPSIGNYIPGEGGHSEHLLHRRGLHHDVESHGSDTLVCPQPQHSPSNCEKSLPNTNDEDYQART
jgi:hypothetical protein